MQGEDKGRGAVIAQVLPPQGCDEQTADMMARLDRLQGWLVLKCAASRGDPNFMSASMLIQDTRSFIVERLFKQPAPPIPRLGSVRGS